VKPLFAALLVFLPAQVIAQDFTEDDVERYIAAIAENGCTMTEDEAKELIPAAGFTQEMSIAIATQLLEDGRATADEDIKQLTLADELCE
jgi:hypothetical protein